MNRLQSTMLWDVRLQFRNGFYYASLAIVVVSIALISQVPREFLARFFPVFILGNMMVATFYFFGGLVLLEKGEGTLTAQIVTPLRRDEYLVSKLVTLTALSALENGAITLFAFWGAVNLLPLLLGIVVGSVLYCLTGFLAVVRYDSLNEYLIPSMGYTMVTFLPMLAFLAGWDSWLVYLHPWQASLALLQAAWEPVAAWQWVYGLGYGLLWAVILYRAARRAFYDFVVIGQGVRA